MGKTKQIKKLIEYLNYKDILIILGTWYLIALVLLITKELNFNHTILTGIFHFLFILSGRFIYFSLMTLYLTSLYSVDFVNLGLKFNGFKRQVKDSFYKIIVLLTLVISLLNIPLSFNTVVKFSPLFKIIGPDSFISSLLPLSLIFLGCLFISLSEQFILNVIIFELFNYTIFNRFFSTILSSLFYSIIIMELTPNKILVNTLIALISILLYNKERSIIPSSIFIAAYYAIYITYIYGFNFLRF